MKCEEYETVPRMSAVYWVSGFAIQAALGTSAPSGGWIPIPVAGTKPKRG